MTAEQRDVLTDHDSGRWRISTESSTYVLDLDTRISTRIPGDGEDAVGLRRDGAALPLIRLVTCERGAAAMLLLDVRGDGYPTLRMTTSVQRITRAHE